MELLLIKKPVSDYENMKDLILQQSWKGMSDYT